VISGDSVTDFDLTKALQFHKKNSQKQPGFDPRSNPIEFVVITGEDYRIRRF